MLLRPHLSQASPGCNLTNSCGALVPDPAIWQLGLLQQNRGLLIHAFAPWLPHHVFHSKPLCSLGWTCISCGCRILWSYPDPGIKSFPCISSSSGTLFIRKLHPLTDASLAPWCCIPITSTTLTESSGCDSSSGLWCSQVRWVDLGIKPGCCSSNSLAVAAGQRSPYKANCFHRKHGRESWTTQTWWKRSTSGWNCQWLERNLG